jgi:hypothetical protein
LAQPLLTMPFLRRLPPDALLRDVQAHYIYGGQLTAWTRWPQATPAEIIDDMRLQRRFAPVLTWRCAEIRLPPRAGGNAHPTRPRIGARITASVGKEGGEANPPPRLRSVSRF